MSSTDVKTPPRPLCVIHIGPHKTGSTSIQNFMAANAAELLRHGVLYPNFSGKEGRQTKRHGVLKSAKELGVGRAIGEESLNWRKLETALEGHAGTVVLSSEFYARTFREMKNLELFVDFFDGRGYDVRILAYVRDQPDWLNSWYVENQKRLNGLHDFAAFAASAAESGRADPWRYLEHIVDNPRLTLEVVSFERAAKAGLEQDFARRVGVPAEAALAPPMRYNANAGAKAVYAAREIMRRAGVDIRQLDHYTRVFRYFRTAFEAFGGDRRPYSALDADTHARISAQYREGNDRFARRFFGVSWADLHPERPRSPSVFDPAEAPEDERREVEAAIENTLAVIAGKQPARMKAAKPAEPKARPDRKTKAARRAALVEAEREKAKRKAERKAERKSAAAAAEAAPEEKQPRKRKGQAG